MSPAQALVPLAALSALLSSVVLSGVAVADPLVGSNGDNGRHSVVFDRSDDETLVNNSIGPGHFVWCQNQVTNTLITIPQSFGLGAAAASVPPPAAAIATVLPQSPPVSTAALNAPSHNQCA